MALTPRSVFRYYETEGVPSSGDHKPKKDEIIQLLETIFGVSRGGWVVALTLEELNGVTPDNETDGGVVLADPDVTQNGYYGREGGAWVKGRGFPDTFARVALSGDGAAQVGEVRTGVNPADIEVFFAFVETANVSSLTLAIGGEEPREVVNLAGNPLSAGEWTGAVMFALRDDKYQLLLDAGAAASAAQSASEAEADRLLAEGLKDNAEDAAERAETAAAGVEFPISYGAAQALTEAQRKQARQNIRDPFPTVADLLADTDLGYSGDDPNVVVAEGDIIEAQGFRYEVQSSGSSVFLETAGGVKLECVDQFVSIEAYGTDKDNWDEDAVRAALRTKRIISIDGPGWDGNPTPAPHITLYIDPVNGDDGNFGGADDPLQHIQEAADRVPFWGKETYMLINCRDANTIALPAVFDEDLRVGPYHWGGSGSAAQGSVGKVQIKGDPATPTNCQLGSVLFVGVSGPKTGLLEGFHMLRAAPDDGNEGAAIQAQSSREVGIHDVSFADTGIRRGVLAYNSTMDVRRVDATNITDHPISAKRSGKITVQNPIGTFNPTHDASTQPFESREGSYISYIDDQMSYSGVGQPGGTYSDGGTILDADRELAWSDEFKYFGVVASATRTTPVSPSSGVNTTLGLQAAISDNRGRVDTSNNRINLVRDGLYEVKARVNIDTSTISDGQGAVLQIVDGNSTVLAEESLMYGGGTARPYVSLSVSTVIDLFDSTPQDRQISFVFRYDGSGTCTLASGRRYFEVSAQKLG